MTTRKEDTRQHNGQIETINVFDYFNVLLKWKRFIGWNLLILMLAVLGMTFLMPEVFKSKVSLLPPKEKGVSASGLLQLTRDILPGSALNRLSAGKESYNYLA
ncbi:MAG TPA: Wzz/FepE/Etk N-terminal domain-containing protein, partial [Bacteroidota bacterium]